jgi:hypothetical protein
MSPAAIVSGALGFGAPVAVAPADPADVLPPLDVADEFVELSGVLPQPLSNATEQMPAIPTDGHKRGRIPDPRRLMRPTGPDPDEREMRTVVAPGGLLLQRLHS